MMYIFSIKRRVLLVMSPTLGTQPALKACLSFLQFLPTQWYGHLALRNLSPGKDASPIAGCLLCAVLKETPRLGEVCVYTQRIGLRRTCGKCSRSALASLVDAILGMEEKCLIYIYYLGKKL